jgi:tetratricopeptide (TPR) repeat protein
MKPIHRLRPGRFVPLGLTLAASIAAAQTPPQQPGLRDTREATWPAPTAEDWKKPCLIPWQRTYEDALAVSRETQKPILVCVNMDGEIASEHYAGVRYRDPEIAKLYEPYVCVIASVYRHNPRDYDEEGRRILCPRFGSVTCGEHIWIEPGLFEKFFEGKRIAPRHIGVELDSAEMYDVYYAWDTQTIFDSLRDGIANRTVEVREIARGDRPVLERVSSRDNADRTAVERAYAHGDAAARRALLEAALASPDVVHVDLLRLALRGFDADLNRLARLALAQAASPDTIDLIAEALRVPMEAREREALIAALERIGETAPRAKTIATVYRGLSRRSDALDVESWSRVLVESPAPPAPAPDRPYMESRLAQAEQNAARATDPDASLELAEATLAVAVDQNTSQRFARAMFEEAQRAALAAEALGARGWRVDSTIAIAASYLGDAETAHARAEKAVAALPLDSRGWNALAVLAIFAQSRQQAIEKAIREKKEWPAQWLADVHAAYSVLARHPLGTDAQVVAHYDFLGLLGAAAESSRVLEEGLARFPDSWLLHDRLRGRVLREKGVDHLEERYAAMLREKGASPNLQWFAGYASFVVAEFKKREGKDDEALAAYGRAIAHYEHGVAANPESRESADHYVALALAGKAWIAYEREDYERAVAELIASFERRPDAAASLDGLNRTPASTARIVLSRLHTLQREELADRLAVALSKLDPVLLLPPAFEREGATEPSPDARGPRRRRG